MDKTELLREKYIRLKARADLKTFLKLKWERYNKAPFLDSWHIDLICSALSCTLKEYSDKENTELYTRLMLNMPPSYGKTEIIARTFIAWALGRDRTRKIIYISYSDDLCRKINNQVRDLLNSSFWLSIFGRKPEYLQSNSSEFVLKEGGGLFVTTLKSAITGFHAHTILIDDPIKVSGMSSRLEREAVNQNFKESVLSRLQDKYSNITILMQLLGLDDLCGYLLDEKNFDKEVIEAWKVIKLEAINKEARHYQAGKFNFYREKNTPLFEAKHTLKDLEHIKKQMGDDEFATQYLQDPQVSEAGYFLPDNFKLVYSYELEKGNEYIFVDCAMSLNSKSDNRAIVSISVDEIEKNPRYAIFDCDFGIWSEEITAKRLVEMMYKYPLAHVYIESDGGGLVLKQLLDKALVEANTKLKQKDQKIITNPITLYPASRKIPKVEKIKAMRAFYNTGHLVFLNTSRGLDQIKKELFSFNPEKPFRKDDCIDAIASCISHSSVKARRKQERKYNYMTQLYKSSPWRL